MTTNSPEVRRPSAPRGRAAAACLTVAIALSTTSCVSLTASEREAVDALETYGIPLEEEHSQGAAMALNVLPGVGNFYLDQTGYGVMNLLLWPVSVAWGMPQAWIDTPRLNKRATVDHYRTLAGKRRLAGWFEQRGEEPPGDLRAIFGIFPDT